MISGRRTRGRRQRVAEMKGVYEHELIIPDQGFLFKVFPFEGRDGNYVRAKHWHRSVEIFAVYEGALTLFLNDAPFLLGAGQMMLVNSNEIHSISAPEPNRTLVLQIPLSVFEGYYTEGQFIDFVHSLGDDGEVMRLLEEIACFARSREAGYDWKARSAFAELVFCLITRYRSMASDAERLKRCRRMDRLSKITDFMREQYAQELTLERVADEFGYSPTYLSRMFRKYAGINFKVYLQEIRLELAFREYAGSGRKASDIAMDYGFASSRAFAREFKRKYGMTPREFRRRQETADK